jgi:hypothetical protein
MVEKAILNGFPACPHCGQRMLRRHGADLPPTSAAIFDLIEASRSRGVMPETLAWVFFPNKPLRSGRRLVAVHINRLNDFLSATDVHVRMSSARFGAYVVKRRRGGAGHVRAAA